MNEDMKIKKFLSVFDVRKILEYLENKLEEKEDKLEEMEVELMEQIWNIGGTEIDMSWCATQASVEEAIAKIDNLQSEITTLKGDIGVIKEDTNTMKSWMKEYIVPKPEPATAAELANWEYTLDEENSIITLNKYIGNQTNITVYSRYTKEDKVYNTYIGNNTNDSTSPYDNYMFSGTAAMKYLKVETITFQEGINSSNVTNMKSMFMGCRNLTNINGLEYLDTSNVTNMRHMFNDCTALTSLDLSTFDTSNVTNMNSMFLNLPAIELDLTSFDTHNVTDMKYMFGQAYITKVTVSTSKFVIPAGLSETDIFYRSKGCTSFTYVN